MAHEEKNQYQVKEQQISDFARKLAKKYNTVFDEPVPDQLADLIQRLRELKPN